MEKVTVLASGGLDSSVLISDLARTTKVFPVYVSKGMFWEPAERRILPTFIDAVGNSNIQPVVDLSLPIQAFYDKHWSITGVDVPDATTGDNAVFLPGRNVLLLSLAAVWSSIQGITQIAIGSLGANPFSDATQEFFDNFAKVLSNGLDAEITISAPYRGLTKEELIRRNTDLPLGLTLTCISPKHTVHCGDCNKCHERRSAFVKAKIDDPTIYSTGAK